MTRLAIIVAMALPLLNATTVFAEGKADLVLLNGKIWTVNKAQPEAEALAVWHGRITAVGNSNDIRALAGENTKVIDLKGRRLVPGFYDSHIHLLGSGERLSEVALKDAENEEEFGRRLRDFDRKLPRYHRDRRSAPARSPIGLPPLAFSASSLSTIPGSFGRSKGRV